MMSIRFGVSSVLMGLVLPSLVLAQAPTAVGPEGTVSTTGMVTLKRAPNRLRVNLELTAQGSDLKEALSNIADEREGARSKLASLAAVEDSIEIGETLIGAGATMDPRLRQYQQALSMSRGRTAQTPSTQPSGVTVSSVVQAEWELADGGSDALLVAGDELQKKIKEAFASGARKLSPEEQELLEEMRGSGMMMPDQPNPGDPKFIYVHKLSDEAMEKALSEAFEKAKSDAARLARAAGAQLGSVRQLSTFVAPGSTESQQYGYAWAYDGGVYQAGARARGTAAGLTNEATGAQPGNVSLIVTVSASFNLK